MDHTALPGMRPEFVQCLTASQSALYAFVVSLMGGVDEANDVLQETNLKLCRKAQDYDANQPFLRWAYVFARFEVMAWHKGQQRSKWVLDDELIAQVAQDFDESAATKGHQLNALEKCVEKLPPRQRELIAARYGRGEPVKDIAVRLNQSENSLAALLYRMRTALADCIDSALPKRGTI